MAGLSPTAAKQLMESGKFSDLTVTCKGTIWKLHKAVAVSLSSYIEGASSGKFDGGAEDTVEFKEQHPRVLQSVFEWMYTGQYFPPTSLESRNRVGEGGEAGKSQGLRIKTDHSREEAAEQEEEDNSGQEETEISGVVESDNSSNAAVTPGEIAFRIDIATYACADYLLIDGCRKAIADHILLTAENSIYESWFIPLLQELCEKTRADDKVIRAPIFKLLLDHFDNIEDEQLRGIIKEQEPVGYYIAAQNRQHIAELRSSLATFARTAEINQEELSKTGNTGSSLNALKDLIAELSPKCQMCKRPIKNDWGAFTLETTAYDPAGHSTCYLSYYVQCQSEHCHYRQYLHD